MKKCLAILAILAIGLTLPSCSKDNGQTPTLETEGTTTQGTSGTTSPSGGPADTTDTMENTSSSALDTTASTKPTSKTDSTSKNTTTDPITSPTASATETPTEPSAAPPPVTEPEPKMNVLVIGEFWRATAANMPTDTGRCQLTSSVASATVSTLKTTVSGQGTI